MKLKIYIVVVVVGLVVAGGLYYFYSINSSKVYRNNLLKYEVTIPSGWRVSKILSEVLDEGFFVSYLTGSVGCDIINFANQDEDVTASKQKFSDCMRKSSDLSKIQLLNDEYLRSWKIENAHNVFITRLTLEEEDSLSFSDLNEVGKKIPQGSFIRIFPLDYGDSFTKVISSSKIGIVTSFYFLKDNTKTYLVDTRETKLDTPGLTLYVPIISNEKSLYPDPEVIGGGEIKSLMIRSTATKGSQEEKDFYSFIDSIKINK